MTTRKRSKARFVPAIVIAIVLLALAIGALTLVRGFLANKPSAPKKVVQEIHLIRPPPPPPDLPPPPPPPPEEEKIKIAEPQPADPTPSNEPPPGEQLGLDAEGGAGGDAFGLVGHKGGHDLIGGGGSAFAWYAGLLKGEVLAQLGDEKLARSGAYVVIVKIWVRSDGSVERYRLAQSSGDRDRDHAIENALSRVTRVSQGPPADMPQPISLRIVSRV